MLEAGIHVSDDGEQDTGHLESDQWEVNWEAQPEDCRQRRARSDVEGMSPISKVVVRLLIVVERW